MAVRKYYITGEKPGRKSQDNNESGAKRRGRPKSEDSKGIERWEYECYYTDYKGNRMKRHKRGFITRAEALAAEAEFKERDSHNINMSLNAFIDEYLEYKCNSLKYSTKKTKMHIIESNIRPNLGKRTVSEITANDIRAWQADIKKGEYAESTLKTINDCLQSIFQYAVDEYNLPFNPVLKAGKMGSEKPRHEMQIWTNEEMQLFLGVIRNKEISYYIFLTLFYTGIRLGELLALQIRDVDLENNSLSITKTLSRINGEDFITSPKTENSERVVELPPTLTEELRCYIDSLYGASDEDRLFEVSKGYIEKEIKRGAKLAGLKPIRVHDLRHSHASMLICELGVPIELVSKRLGHKNIQTTMNRYLHLYPHQGRDVATKIDNVMVRRCA